MSPADPARGRRSARRPEPHWTIDVADCQQSLRVDAPRLRRAVEAILAGEGRASASISLAIVDDAEMADLHRRFLQIAGPTDVLSFVLEDDGRHLDGEVIASAQTARRVAAEIGWPAEAELLLYVVHGTLHLLGYDDLNSADRRIMRDRERQYLTELGTPPPAAKGAAGRPRRSPAARTPGS